MLEVSNRAEIEVLRDPLFIDRGLHVCVLRLDTIHPTVSGNKWYKLKYNLLEFHRQQKQCLVTFGGAYSNHLVATAAACKEEDIYAIGIVRGEELDENSNDSLRHAASCGMKLFFVSRNDYRNLRDDHSSLISKLPFSASEIYFIPEGGSNDLAVKGCKEIVEEIQVDFDFICCACGTGGTIAGISSALKNHQQAIGVSVLKEAGYLSDRIKHLSKSPPNFQLIDDYNFGGYAKTTSELNEFCRLFSSQNNIPIEPVYTGKLFYGIYDLVRKGFFEKGKTIVFVHSGGVKLI